MRRGTLVLLELLFSLAWIKYGGCTTKRSGGRRRRGVGGKVDGQIKFQKINGEQGGEQFAIYLPGLIKQGLEPFV